MSHLERSFILFVHAFIIRKKEVISPQNYSRPVVPDPDLIIFNGDFFLEFLLKFKIDFLRNLANGGDIFHDKFPGNPTRSNSHFLLFWLEYFLV